ncbi:MAG: hypothetical protein ABSA31_04950 [Acidimicrobiales bacterium]|jgi:hypothetical protein
MESAQPLVYLTTVVGTVAGHLVVGRLRAEGIAACASGPVDGPYPFPIEIDVLVPADELARAKEVLLADAVEASFDELGGRSAVARPRRRATPSGRINRRRDR